MPHGARQMFLARLRCAGQGHSPGALFRAHQEAVCRDTFFAHFLVNVLEVAGVVFLPPTIIKKAVGLRSFLLCFAFLWLHLN